MNPLYSVSGDLLKMIHIVELDISLGIYIVTVIDR